MRLHGSSSSTANPAGGNRSKQQSQKGQGNNQQQHKKTNVNSHNAKNQPNDSNNGRPKPRNTPHVNAKKNGKPKPSVMTVGAMLPLGKKKKLKKDVNDKTLKTSIDSFESIYNTISDAPQYSYLNLNE